MAVPDQGLCQDGCRNCDESNSNNLEECAASQKQVKAMDGLDESLSVHLCLFAFSIKGKREPGVIAHITKCWPTPRITEIRR